MRPLADENIPRPSVRLLRVAGRDIEAVAEFGPGLPYAEVLARAATHKQVLITFDRDSGELIYRTEAALNPRCADEHRRA